MPGKANKNAAASQLAFDIVNYAIFGMLMFLCLYPFWYIFVYSISDSLQAIKGVTLLPRGLTLTNYADVFKYPGLPLAAVISVLRTVIGTALTVLCCSFFAYLMTKRQMYLRKFIYRMLVITMYLNAGLIPWYLVLRAYGFAGNPLVYIVPSALSAYYVILIKTFIEQLPASLEEAALIDGAGYITIYARVILPLSIPIVATIIVFAAVGQWNSWFDNLIFMTGADASRYNTLQLMLWQIINRASTISTTIDTATAEQLAKRVTPSTIRMTVTMIVTFPVLFVYPFAQRFFIKGLVVGAIKG